MAARTIVADARDEFAMNDALPDEASGHSANRGRSPPCTSSLAIGSVACLDAQGRLRAAPSIRVSDESAIPSMPRVNLQGPLCAMAIALPERAEE